MILLKHPEGVYKTRLNIIVLSELNSIDLSSVSCASAAIRSEIAFNSNKRRLGLLRSAAALALPLTSSWGLGGPPRGAMRV